MFFITFIFFFVFVAMARTLLYFDESSNDAGCAANVVHGTAIEII
jgi:heme/copper-type cytochrome/quinol oxidase subunit 2